MRTKPATTESKQIGAKIDATLWKELRKLAIEQDRTATQLLNEAMREYLAKHKSKGGMGI